MLLDCILNMLPACLNVTQSLSRCSLDNGQWILTSFILLCVLCERIEICFVVAVFAFFVSQTEGSSMGKKADVPAADEEEAEKTQTAEEEEEAEEKDQEEEPAQEKPKNKTKAKAKTKAAPKARPKGTPKASAKATAKATPKATAKATPKATLKAAPKATPKATPKAAPKAKAKANPDSEKPKPRPKGKRTMAEALTEEWRNGLAPEKPEQEKEEEEEPDQKRRGRSKQNKFNVLLAAGAVPASMRKEWEALKTAGSRKNQSRFIEDMVVRDEGTGRLALSCDKGSEAQVFDWVGRQGPQQDVVQGQVWGHPGRRGAGEDAGRCGLLPVAAAEGRSRG